MKKTILLVLNSLLVIAILGQKQTFDVVSFSAPADWLQQQNEAGIQLSVTDKKTGEYAITVITKSMTSAASANENFTANWDRLVKSTVQVNGEPTMEEPTQENGWTIFSGSTNYTDGANTGMATLLTATGAGKTVSVVLMTNTKKYQEELLIFLKSLKLSDAVQSEKNVTKERNTVEKSLVGLWTDYMLETNGYYVNGMPVYTSGYMRKEYMFNSDGTYIFRNKQWMTKAKDILFIFESGTYELRNNQLILTPKNGKGGFWSKATSTLEWGKPVSTTEYKLEKVTYTFEIKYFPGSDNYSLILTSTKPTERDGGQFNAPNEAIQFHYILREKLGSLIDNPPGLKTGFEHKLSAQTASATSNNNTQTSKANSSLAGKIWEGTASERFAGNGGTSYNTGGFSTHQYKFNADGTYRFVQVVASHYTATKMLCNETGTYKINGDELIITPVRGQDEEWSKIGKTSNGNSDVTNRAINDTWGKKLKTSSRKLENYTYTFSIGKNGKNTALILRHSDKTEREGEGSVSYLNETVPGKSVKLPGEIK